MKPENNDGNEWQQPQETDTQVPFSVYNTDDSNINNQDNMSDSQDSLGDNNTGNTPEPSKDDISDDQILVRWQSPEHMQNNHGVTWYVIFGFATLILILIAILIIHSITFAILVPVMAGALLIYTRREPEILQYTLSKKGLYVNDRLYPFSEFKSFGVIKHSNLNSVLLIPLKRFQVGQTIYFGDEVGEKIVDMLASRLPVYDIKPDLLDRILEKLHLN